MIRKSSRLIMPTPLPPKMQLTHIPTHRRERGHRIQAVVLAVDRAAGNVDRHRREGGAGGGPEAQLLALEVAQVLIDRQSGNRRRSATCLPPGALALGISNVWPRMGGQPGIGFQRVIVDRPDDRPHHQHQHDREDHHA